MSVEVHDHTEEFEDALQRAIADALDEIGAVAASHADANVVKAGRVDTGDLHQRIEHRVVASEKTVYVGTNVKYAIYHELGSGTFAEGGKGRKGWWVYVPGSDTHGGNSGKVYSFEEAKRIMAMLRSKGLDAHMTQGIKPIHYLKHAATGHAKEYSQILEDHLKG